MTFTLFSCFRWQREKKKKEKKKKCPLFMSSRSFDEMMNPVLKW